MKGKNLAILAVMAIVLIGLAVHTSKKESRATPGVLGKKLMPDLPVNDIERIVVRTAQSTAEVARAEGGWVIPSRYGYPADFTKLRGALLKLSELKIGQVLRVTDAQRKALGILPPGSTNAAGTTVDLLGAGGRKIASLLIGAEHTRKAPQGMGYGGYPDGQYVSPDGGKSVYLVSQTLEDLASGERDWMDAEIMNVRGADIEKIVIGGAGRADVALSRKADGAGLELEGLKPTEELEQTKVSGVESALSYLRLADVADPALTDEQLGMTLSTVYRAETKNGEVYTVRVGGSPTNDTRRYVKAAVSLKPAAPAAATNAVAGLAATNAAAGGTNAAPDAAKAAAERKQLEDSVRALNEKLARWTFVIDASKADDLAASRDKLVKAKEVPKPAEGTNAPPAQAAGAPEAEGK